MPGAERLAEPLRSRWSPSVFDPDHEIGEEEIRTLLEAARWAPSWGNTQPWRLGVARRGDAAHRALVAHLSRGNATWVPRASVVLLAGTQVAQDEDGNGPDEPTYSLYDLGQAAAHVTLQARAMGLHAHQFAGFDHDAVAAAVGLPAYVRIVSGIAIGVPGDPALAEERDRSKQDRPRVRRPLDEIAYGEHWGRSWHG
jgi:nitroreductase